ncbi:MAG: hypothetical protein LBF42_03390 [Puniceicoccales bacterium]|jgi:hypothetical protein|nr:hypothetical protein [Puniceicoccales bacterium]
MATPDITPVIQAIETQTKTMEARLPEHEFYEEIQKAIAASSAKNEANTNAVRALMERIEATPVRPSEETLTQKVYNVVKGVREQFNDFNDYIQTFVNGPLSTAKMFELQYKVTQLSVMMDVSSKVGDKGSQAFQTLFRNQ